jgi:hypothetical protein
MYTKENYESSRRLNPKINDLIRNHKQAPDTITNPQKEEENIQNRNQNKTILSFGGAFCKDLIG